MNDICYNINTGYDESDEFVCSNCGIQLRGWYSIEQYRDGDIEYNDYEFNFCPNCGAKIKRIEQIGYRLKNQLTPTNPPLKKVEVKYYATG